MPRQLLIVAALVAALVAAACGDSAESTDIVGPFTGPTHRFVVDLIRVPVNTVEARSFGGDLDGDGNVENQLGSVIATLALNGNVTEHGEDMLVAGTVRMTVEITADDLVDDPTVGVRLTSNDERAIEVGGTLVAGRFVSNRTATTAVPGKGVVVLPVFTDADPSVLPLAHVQLELALDGNGVLTGLVQGAADPETVVDVAFAGARQMLDARPRSHRMFMILFENAPRDWQLDRAEFASNSLLRSLLAPEIEIAGREMLGLGFAIRARACASGTCMEGLPYEACFDRRHAASESGIDCGGACTRACAGGEGCVVPADCQSGACGVDGTCAAPSCSDGVVDAFETDLDCGGGCGGCALGLRCYDDADCASLQCGPPCPAGEICLPTDERCEPAR